MFVVMHCGGIPFNGDTIKTKSLGGSESAAYYVARELAKLKHNVILFTNSQDTGTFDGVKYEFCGEMSDKMPLGDRFTFYAENTPHDLCIIQRHPRAFERKWASKQNFWWVHDLALYRYKDQVIAQMWNVDKVLCVSEYHKKQIAAVYGLPLDILEVVGNGVDVSLYDTTIAADFPANEYHLFYSSRPERGLINLVKPDGIMERLADKGVHLHVCGYENTTPQMADEYQYLWGRCAALPNVTNHGALSKVGLAALQKACQAWVYPTEFEEVSCITAMEAMAAGCLLIATEVGALPETCRDSQSIMLSSVVPDKFVRAILAAKEANPQPAAHNYALALSKSWELVMDKIWAASRMLLGTAHPLSLAHHFIRHSDVIAFEKLDIGGGDAGLPAALKVEYEEAYRFYRENTYAEHYAKVYQREEDRGIHYGPEDVTRTSRFCAVANHVAGLPAGSTVLDYGCAHGHYVVALARSFPKLSFVGADISQSNLDKATAWAKQEGLTNISFIKVDGIENGRLIARDAAGVAGDLMLERTHCINLIIAAEVIEHVGNPQEYIDTLGNLLSPKGLMVLTTPYGPWEAQGYREHGYWRAHLHHFERADLNDMLGHHPNYNLIAAPSGVSQFHSPLGSYIISFGKPTQPSLAINYTRKILTTMPDQTLTCCMIVKNAEANLRKCLLAVLPHVQEVVVGVDPACTDDTVAVIDKLRTENPLVGFDVFTLPSPVTSSGFAFARNATLLRANGDWVLWIDDDEVLTNGHIFSRYLRNSMYNGYAIHQHHMSSDPVGVIKVDIPCRLFRNHLGIQFFGAVHEHPEIKLNEGLGPVSMMPQANILHHGYTTEGVRRNRFKRNLPLLERDRAELPDRLLGKFLWLRDLAQSCQYDVEEQNINPVEFSKRIDEGFKMWEELMASKNHRLLVDALPFFSQLAVLHKGGVDFSFAVDASLTGESDAGKQPIIHGYFPSKSHALALMNELASSKFVDFDARYL